jgi:hypothetical protein
MFFVVIFFSNVNYAQTSELTQDVLILNYLDMNALVAAATGVNVSNNQTLASGILSPERASVGTINQAAKMEMDNLTISNFATNFSTRTILNRNQLIFSSVVGGVTEEWQVGRYASDPSTSMNPFTISRYTEAFGGGVTSATALYIDPVTMQVGIGKIPNDALDVFGDIDASGCIQTGDGMTVGGTCVSDERFKTQITSLENQLDNILALRPVRFRWKETSNHGHQQEDVGLIAQEVEQVLPDMVVNDPDGYKRVQYDIRLQMRMIRALQEQQDIIEEQKRILEMQEERFMVLEDIVRQQGKQLESTKRHTESLDHILAEQARKVRDTESQIGGRKAKKKQKRS